MNYTCEYCGKIFNQKSHYDTHKNKKIPCKKCDKNFITEWAYINNEYLHISSIDKKSKNKIRCKNGHELVFCSGNIKRPYFRHKNPDNLMEESEMSEWHCRWQGYFKNTEVEFNKINEKQIKNRRADVLLNDKYILEIQHSNIEESEVICRNKDYELHDKELIWMIDGNTNDIILEKLSDDSYLIEFNNNWKYKSFAYKYKFILVDIKGKIFKIAVNNVCNKLFHAKSHVDMYKVINILTNNPDNIWNLWSDINEKLPILKIIQEGAGNGKTFGIWKKIALNFDKELYIITTKQHTAKNVILEELNKQAERHEFHIIDNMEELEDERYNKQYIIRYKHKYSNKKCKIIIGTIDSFIWGLTSKSINGNSYFEGLLNNICKNGCDKINKNTGEIYYAGEKIKLNRKCELWVDETQDLQINYYKAIIKLILNTKIDCIIVGDKLQSLEYEKNFMTYIEDNNLIEIIREKPKNINRRIKVKYMSEKINNIIKFNDYELPEITTDSILKDYGEYLLEPFTQKCIYADDRDKEKLENEVEKIIEKVKYQVDKYNYKPKDFLFIFPIMKSNILAFELETKLNNFWLDKVGNDNKYEQYAVLHKHEEGQIIDTKNSEQASRIMSIRASKGDGRAVVFILNCTEQSLKLLTNGEKNIVYESYLHVALTRAEYKIYFGLQENNDDIHKRISNIDNNIEYEPSIRTSISIEIIIQNINKIDCIEILKNNNIDENEEEENTNSISCIIDWEYHCIRHSIYYMYALFEIFQSNKDNDIFKTSQIKTILDKISDLKIDNYSPKNFYIYLKHLYDMEFKERDKIFHIFPLCDLSHKKIYKKYYKIIKEKIINIQKNYKKDNLSIGHLEPVDASILLYLIDIYKNLKFHSYTPTTLYNIIDSFEKKDNVEKLIQEAKNMKIIMEDLMKNILKNNNIIWNLEHLIYYDGNTKDINFKNKYSIIGHDNYKVYHLIFQTDYNKLNYYDTIIKILIERFIIYNSKSNEQCKNNKTRFYKKKITTYLLILKQNKYEIFDWDFENDINNEIKNLCKDAIIKYYKTFNNEIFNYCKFIKKFNSKWKEFKTPYKFIANDKNLEFNKITYVKNFFNDLDKECKNNFENVKNITNDFDLFEKKINEYIVDMIETFFTFSNSDVEIIW